MKSLIVILSGLYGTWSYIDLRAENGFYSVFMPLMFAIFLMAFFIWVAVKVKDRATTNSDSGYGGDIGGFGDGF